MTRKKTKTVAGPPPLSPAEVQSLRDFVILFALGDGHLTAWEENFLNDLKISLSQPPVWLSEKQQAVVLQIKDKLHYDRPDVPLPPIDPDGLEENDDPDGGPVTRRGVDQFQDDELLDAWPGANGD